MVSVLPRTTDSDPFKPRTLQFSLRAIDSFRRSKNDIQTAELWVIEQKGRVHDPVPCFRVACMPTLRMLLPTFPKGNCAHVLSTQKAKTDSPNLMLKLLFLTPIRVTNQCDPLWSPDQPSLSLLCCHPTLDSPLTHLRMAETNSEFQCHCLQPPFLAHCQQK